jgi:hypothetical protein
VIVVKPKNIMGILIAITITAVSTYALIELNKPKSIFTPIEYTDYTDNRPFIPIPR